MKHLSHFLFIPLFMVLTGCGSQAVKPFQLDSSHHAISFDNRIKFVVLHYTDETLADSLHILTKGPVSAHYLVSEQKNQTTGKVTVYQLVPETKRAWHAGKSFWRDRKNINDTSIGIEIVNLGYRTDAEGNRTWQPYPKEQIAAVEALVRSIVQRYGIAAQNIVGHMDIAPQRKLDPGPLFPWQQLAQAGLGAWPEADRVYYYLAGRSPSELVAVGPIQKKLARYGYEVPQSGVLDRETSNTLSAFQMHFRPANTTGLPDAESEAILDALLERYDAGGPE
ncbi:MAG: N-acetylmuramoyl-L-alanine amidase [Enterobacteriaceae bacterium]